VRQTRADEFTGNGKDQAGLRSAKSSQGRISEEIRKRETRNRVHLSICGALEEAFEIRFPVNDMAKMNSVRAIVFIIKEKKKAC
jgi:hypothetical protein